jgi:hypothetical protein
MKFRCTAMSAGQVATAASRMFLILMICAFSLPALAQSTAGRILGTVTDQSGAAVAGATVVVTDVAARHFANAHHRRNRGYVAPTCCRELTRSTWRRRVSRPGAAECRHRSRHRRPRGLRAATGTSIGDGGRRRGVPLVNTTSSTLGGTLSNEEINDLPLNGRNYENLLQLRPGVMRYPGGGFSTTSANGLRAEDNAYYIEGLFNSEPYSGQAIINGAGIAGDSATILPIDSIQEFNLQQNPPAEYGWKPGAVVNVGLKSGTNKVHGTAFGFGRDGSSGRAQLFQ